MTDIKFDIVARNIHFNEIRHTYLTFEQVWERNEVPTWLHSTNAEIIAIRRSTGLIDNNDIDIYEGDILRLGTGDCIVYWNREYSAWWLRRTQSHTKFYFNEFSISYAKGNKEVIGNIYDYSEKKRDSHVYSADL